MRELSARLAIWPQALAVSLLTLAAAAATASAADAPAPPHVSVSAPAPHNPGEQHSVETFSGEPMRRFSCSLQLPPIAVMLLAAC